MTKRNDQIVEVGINYIKMASLSDFSLGCYLGVTEHTTGSWSMDILTVQVVDFRNLFGCNIYKQLPAFIRKLR